MTNDQRKCIRCRSNWPALSTLEAYRNHACKNSIHPGRECAFQDGAAFRVNRNIGVARAHDSLKHFEQGILLGRWDWVEEALDDLKAFIGEAEGVLRERKGQGS